MAKKRPSTKNSGKGKKKKADWRKITMWVLSLLIVISMLLAFIVMALGPSNPSLAPNSLIGFARIFA